MEGSILDVFKAYEQGRDIIAEHKAQQQGEQPLRAETPEERKEGLRPYHQAGETNKTMVFPDTEPGAVFNTRGMKAPIDIEKVDKNGHIVESYKSVPPGIQQIPTGPYEGDIIESPAQYQTGGDAGDKEEKEKKQDVSLTWSDKHGFDNNKIPGTRIMTFADGTQMPVLLGTAEVVANKDRQGLDSVEDVLQRTNAGIAGDYSKIDESKRKEYETGVTKDVSDAGKNMMNVATDVFSWPGRVTTGALLNAATGNRINTNPFAYTDVARGIEQDNYSPSTTLDVDGLGGTALDIAMDPTAVFGLGKSGVSLGRSLARPLRHKINLARIKYPRQAHEYDKIKFRTKERIDHAKEFASMPVNMTKSAAGKAKGRATIRKESDKLMSEVGSIEGRKRLADMIQESRKASGKAAYTDWEMEQVINNRLSTMKGAMDRGAKRESMDGVPMINNAFYAPGRSLKFRFMEPGKTDDILGKMARGENVVFPNIPGKTRAEVSTMYKNLARKALARDASGAVLPDPDDFTLARGYSGTIQLGYGTNNAQVLEHELLHGLQAGSPTQIDSDLTKLISKSIKDGKIKSSRIEDARYMKEGSGYQEGLTYLGETRRYLQDIGLLKNRHDKITSEMLETAYQRTGRGKRSVFSSPGPDVEGDPAKRIGRRLLEMPSGTLKDRMDFYKKLVPYMNKVPAATGVAVGAGVAAQDSKKRGGMVDRRKKRRKRK